MNPSNVNSSPSRPSEGRSRAAIWGLPLIAGVLLFIGGALCLVASGSTGMATMGVFGTVLFVAGIIEITRATRERSEHAPFMPHFLSGVLSLVVGGLFLVHPASGLVA